MTSSISIGQTLSGFMLALPRRQEPSGFAHGAKRTGFLPWQEHGGPNGPNVRSDGELSRQRLIDRSLDLRDAERVAGNLGQ